VNRRICANERSGEDYIKPANDIAPEKGDRVINVEGLIVTPGLIDMHLHLGDLFEVSTNPIFESVGHGVTTALSPGAGNTYMGPSLLGAEVDRGVPMNIGIYLGAANVLGTMASTEELIAYFKGELDEEVGFSKMTRNIITYQTGNLIIGIKDHMGHFLQSDESIDRCFEITDKAKLVFMSHTQDPDHAERVVSLSKGRKVHLGHSNAAGCGTHGDPKESMQRIVELIKQPNVSGEFVTAMLRPGRGTREGLLMPKEAQEVAYQALKDGIVNVLISDGQGDATMKGFADSRENIPCLLELEEMGVITLSQAIAAMTINPARLLSERTGEKWWVEELGHLGKGARANVTVIDPDDKMATITIVNGKVAGFEDRPVREANGAGMWVTKFGMIERTGVGDLAVYSYYGI
jgi:dihydroorotase